MLAINKVKHCYTAQDLCSIQRVFNPIFSRGYSFLFIPHHCLYYYIITHIRTYTPLYCPIYLYLYSYQFLPYFFYRGYRLIPHTCTLTTTTFYFALQPFYPSHFYALTLLFYPYRWLYVYYSGIFYAYTFFSVNFSQIFFHGVGLFLRLYPFWSYLHDNAFLVRYRVYEYNARILLHRLYTGF